MTSPRRSSDGAISASDISDGAVAPTVEHERTHARVPLGLEYAREDDEVVAGLVFSLNLAIEPAGGIIERGAPERLWNRTSAKRSAPLSAN